MIYRRKCLDCRGDGNDENGNECPSCRGYGYILEDDEDREPIAEGDYHLYQPPGRIQEHQG